MERLYVVENGRAAAAGEAKMADKTRALTAYNKFVAPRRKAGMSMAAIGLEWRAREKGAAARAEARAAGRWDRGRGGWEHNPPGEILGMRVPEWLQQVNPIDAANLKNVAAIAGAAIVVVGAPMFAGSYNQGWTGLGLTALAAGIATGGAALLSPALAVPVGIASLAILGLRGVIFFVPRVVGWVVNPLLGWAGASGPAESAGSSGSASGPQASYKNRGLPAGFTRKALPSNMTQTTASGAPAGAGESFVSSRSSY